MVGLLGGLTYSSCERIPLFAKGGEGSWRVLRASHTHNSLYKESPVKLMLLIFVWDETTSGTARSKTENGLYS